MFLEMEGTYMKCASECGGSCGGGRLCPVSFGLAFGITWGLAMFILSLVAWLAHWGANTVHVISELYLGYAPSLVGAFIGAGWGFVDLFVVGVLVAFFYNCISCCCKCGKKKEEKKE